MKGKADKTVVMVGGLQVLIAVQINPNPQSGEREREFQNANQFRLSTNPRLLLDSNLVREKKYK